jgi:hypothetical protein
MNRLLQQIVSEQVVQSLPMHQKCPPAFYILQHLTFSNSSPGHACFYSTPFHFAGRKPIFQALSWVSQGCRAPSSKQATASTALSPSCKGSTCWIVGSGLVRRDSSGQRPSTRSTAQASVDAAMHHPSPAVLSLSHVQVPYLLTPFSRGASHVMLEQFWFPHFFAWFPCIPRCCLRSIP